MTTNGGNPFVTTADGNYAFGGLSGGTTFTIEPSKDTEILLGLTTLDIVRILQHILTRDPLPSPYKIIAADVNKSGGVNSLDLIQFQRLLLDKISEFPNNSPWRFVPESYAFINLTNPLAENFPESLVLTKLEIDTANVDFVAIKVGDVVPEAAPRNARFLPKSMGFEIGEQHFKAGELVSIPFNMEQVKAALGFQFELSFDEKTLAFKGAKKDTYLPVTANNLGTKNLEKGRLKVLWLNPRQLPIRPLKGGLFQLEFIAQKDGTILETIHFIKENFPAQFYSEQSQNIGLQDITLTIKNTKITKDIPTLTLDSPNLSFFNMGESEATGEGCRDSLDNDNDGLIDCADADCFCECSMIGVEPARNFISNPSAEQPIDSGGWNQVEGIWITRGANPSPQNGAAYFYPLNSPLGQLTQEIDLSPDSAAIANGAVTYLFSAYVRSFNQLPADQAQIIVEYKNAADSVLKRYDSGIITSEQDWVLLTDTTLAPLTTTKAIINLIARRINGNNNDAYFDNLSLIKMIDDTCEDPCEDLILLSLTSPAIPNGVGGTATATLAGGTGPATYNWSNGANTSEIMDLLSGAYIIEASDSIGCSVLDTLEVPIDSSFFLIVSTASSICSGDNTGSITVAVTGGIAPFTFVWNDTLLIGDSLMNLAAGNYGVTVTDSTGQVVSSEVTLSDGAMVVLNRDSSKIINENCPGSNDGRVSLVAKEGTSPYRYLLNGGTTFSGVFNGLTAQTYLFSITDASGCIALDSVVIGNINAGIPSSEFTFENVSGNITFIPNIIDSTATYNWNFGNDSTSTEKSPLFTYPNPGVFEVCLIVSNDCGNDTSCLNISTGISGPVTFVVNDLNGVANDTILVPITVENFIGVVSFQNSIQLQDTSIARILGIRDINLASMTGDNFFQVDDNTVTNVWFDATGDGQNVPDNTVIYNLMLMIDTSIDTCVAIDIVDLPVSTQVVVKKVNEVSEEFFNAINGEICTKSSTQVSGNISKETGSAVPGVQIEVSNFMTTPTTDGNGDYVINKLAVGSEHEITPNLTERPLESVSTFDIVLINRHILGTGIFDSPYKIIAADANRSNSISVFDLVVIQRKILRLNGGFLDDNAWRFIPKSYVFLDPSNPFLEDFPESINLNNITGDEVNQDFIAVKIGDVSYNVPDSTNTAAPRNGKSLSLNIDNQSFAAGDPIIIPFSSTDLLQISGFQLELDFDPSKLELTGFEAIDLPNFNENNIGVKYLSQGKIQMIWVAPKVNFTDENTNLFQLNFKAKQSGKLSEVLQLGSHYLPSEVYTDDLSVGEVDLNYKETASPISQKISIYPNPNTGKFDVLFDNPKAEKIHLSVYNLTGQLVQEIKDIEAEKVSLDLKNQSDGTYILVVKRAKGVEVKRVVLSR